MNRNRTLCLLLVLALLLTLFAGCTNQNPISDPAEPTPPETEPQAPATEAPTEPGTDPAETQSSEAPTHVSRAEVEELEPIRLAASYEEIAESFRANMNQYGFGGRGGGFDEAVPAEAAVEEAEAPMSADNAGGYGGGSYGTNVQVAGIDEADSVKTDGEYIYILDDLRVKIVRADGAETAVVCELELPLEEKSSDDGSENVYYYGNAMLITENRMAILVNCNKWGTGEDGNWYDATETHVLIYDTSDKTAPVQIGDLGQDGYYQTARLKDSRVYLITVNSVYSIYEEDVPAEDCTPRIFSGSEYTAIAADRIYLCPEVDYPSFTVVGVYDLDAAEASDSCAFTGSTDVVYMNDEALYLARNVQNSAASEPYTENQYTVVDYRNTAATEIKRISFGADALEMDASCTLDGSLLNQFSLDVYNGNLRAATTTYSYSYSVFTDETYGWENYMWQEEDDLQNSRVTILDADLNELSRVDNLAADERIYSVRFMGDLGYVVTFRSIDPVFTLDLSDPANPTVESALELPGVSQYLHPFPDGKLFGFGQAVTEEGRSEGLQMSMFDVSDPKNVSLEGQEILPDSYSDALYNHHAILVSGADRLIGFPMYGYSDWGCSYMLYSYDDGSFTQRGAIEMEFYPDGARCLNIGGKLYVCSYNEIDVLDLETFSVIAELSSAVG